MNDKNVKPFWKEILDVADIISEEEFKKLPRNGAEITRSYIYSYSDIIYIVDEINNKKEVVKVIRELDNTKTESLIKFLLKVRGLDWVHRIRLDVFKEPDDYESDVELIIDLIYKDINVKDATKLFQDFVHNNFPNELVSSIIVTKTPG